jgi:hypothetical protein
MPTIKIKAYEVKIESEWYDEGAYVLIGVEEDGHPECASWDSYADNKIYFYLSAEEMANLKVGDVLNDGEDFTILEIDPEPTIYESEYELETEAESHV